MSQATKDFKFYIKDVQPSGSFEGMAAVYGNLDLGGDVIEPGAFTRTIKNGGGKVPLLWQHDQREPIGLGKLQDSKEGLMIHGQLVMESPVAQKALGLMKADVLTGLSIGYDTIVSEYDKANDIRKLKELKLWEVSLVTFPMNPKAQVTAVKASMEDMASLIETHMNEVTRGGTLSSATRNQLLHMHERISALLSADSANSDSGKALATQQLSDSDLHSLMTSLKESIQ
jgi:HK97 family phage prohead protease